MNIWVTLIVLYLIQPGLCVWLFRAMDPKTLKKAKGPATQAGLSLESESSDEEEDVYDPLSVSFRIF